MFLAYLPAEPGPSSPCLPGTSDPNWTQCPNVLCREQGCLNTGWTSHGRAGALTALQTNHRGLQEGWQEIQVPEKKQQEV